MGFICGVLGRCDPARVQAMARAMKHRGALPHLLEGASFAVAASSPTNSLACLVDGQARNTAGTPLPHPDLHRYCLSVDEPGLLELRGAFAAALRRDDDQHWWLMRDRLGQKPLYYFQSRDLLVFASELKALLASGLIAKHLNLTSVDRYLAVRCVPGPDTILQDIRRVQPGHVLEYRPGYLREVPFARFDLKTADISREEAADRLVHLLTAELTRRQAAGLLWSGGIDCAALAALKPGLKPIFVTMERAWQDEARLAADAARRLHLALDSHVARRTSEEVFRQVLHHLDEPIADASLIPLWLIAERAGKGSGTLFSGHGADELLGGYPRYRLLAKAQGAHALVPAGLLSGMLPALPPNAFVRRGGRYLASIRDNLSAYLSLVSVFEHDERQALYTDAMRSAVHDEAGLAAPMRPYFETSDVTNNILSLDLHVGLPDLLLTMLDRVTAAHGVALELPYLGDDLVDWAVTLPPHVRFGIRSKPLLRLAMKTILPGRIRLRARRGFRVPQGGRLLQVIEHVARQIITPERADAVGLFKWPSIEQILRSASHNVYRRRQFWALLMFFGWYREVMES
jgi:asparagine synthase (glutamine-hydrolysing)